ncbi:MAG: hypothetical protein ACTSO9_05635 [Candidatus Helarchaeota archaeon]
MDLINLIETTPRSKVETEAMLSKDFTDKQRIEQLKKINHELRQKIIEYEQKVGPNLVLMIKNTLDKFNFAKAEIKKKEERIIELQKEISFLKQTISKLKTIWAIK